MATTADFVGTWYFRGDPTRYCSIRLTGGNRVEVRDENAWVWPARIDGASLIPDNPAGSTGVISSDLQIIQWTITGEYWKRKAG